MAAEAVAPPGTGRGHTAALVPQNLSSSRREQLYEGIDRPTFLTQESLWTGREGADLAHRASESGPRGRL